MNVCTLLSLPLSLPAPIKVLHVQENLIRPVSEVRRGKSSFTELCHTTCLQFREIKPRVVPVLMPDFNQIFRSKLAFGYLATDHYKRKMAIFYN